MLLLSSVTSFQNLRFQKVILGKLLGIQTVWLQIRADLLSALILVQTVSKYYQPEMTIFLIGKECVKSLT